MKQAADLLLRGTPAWSLLRGLWTVDANYMILMLDIHCQKMFESKSSADATDEQ